MVKDEEKDEEKKEKKENPLCARIKASRNIKDASCRTYMSALNKIRGLMVDAPDGEIDKTDFLQDFDKVMDVINREKKLTSKKNKLTAVLVALNSDKVKNQPLLDKFGNELKSLSEKYLAFLKTQKKTDTQEKNWLKYDDLIKVVNKVMKEVKNKEIPLKKAEEVLTNKEFDTLQQYLALRTYIAFPLRNDFADMRVLKSSDYKKLSDGEKEGNNFLVIISNTKKQFHINQFKNKRFIGSKVIDIPQPINKLITLWLKHNKSGFYLVKTDRKTPMNPNSITKFLNKIFLKHTNKKISTSMIRHIVISHSLKGEKTIKQKEKEAKAIENKFLHSNGINQLYRKVDDDEN
jgi:hypothetical protein